MKNPVFLDGGMEVIKARWILPMGSPLIENGEVVVEEGRILSFGSGNGSGLELDEDLGDVILMPGLINAHCHLDYTGMRGAIPPQADFSQWIRRINERKRAESAGSIAAAIGTGLAELQNWGTTSVFNIESFPEVPAQVPQTPLRTWWFGELLDLRGEASIENVMAGMEAAANRHGFGRGGLGLSPHAPYTASPELYRSVGRYCAKRGLPWTSHLAETQEEFDMFVAATGPLYEFLRELGCPLDDVGGCTPVERMLGKNGMPAGGILAHMNHLSPGDYDLLAAWKTEFSVVHCPKCHAYFSRAPFDFGSWRKAQVPVCLGTDSLASNDTLNMFEEMRAVQQAEPDLSPLDILALATLNPAQAIGLPGELGEIRSGAHADLIAIPYSGSSRELPEAVLANTLPVEWMMIGGRRTGARGTGPGSLTEGRPEARDQRGRARQ